MKLNRIKMTDFRNICSMELELCEHANIIYGDNGQGKTNFIEAIWLFTGAKSFRGAKDRQMVRFDAPKATLEMDFYAAGRDQTASMTIESRRSAALNEIPLKSATELAGHFCAVVFSPTHLSLIKNGPQEKRKFIDTSICQIKPKYIHVLSQYTRVLDQRNRLLKDISYETRLFDTLDIWDARLASFAAVLIKTRASFLERLRPFAQGTYAGISGEKEQLDFSYVSSLECDVSADIPTIEQQVLACLQNRRSEDIKMRITNYGPHRDDIEVTLDGNSARVFGSQGQQRSCVLSLKMAECELIRETIGEYPVVLLDDVMSELDISRRDYLLNHLSDRQLIMTCCDKAYFKSLDRGVGVKIQSGQAVLSTKY
ncbi:DNA replication/repair protein RecF [Oscillospiraceae bacterium PP1C4]